MGKITDCQNGAYCAEVFLTACADPDPVVRAQAHDHTTKCDICATWIKNLDDIATAFMLTTIPGNSHDVDCKQGQLSHLVLLLERVDPVAASHIPRCPYCRAHKATAKPQTQA